MILNIDRLQDDDEEHLEHLTIWLSNELNELDIERVEVIDSEKAPEGTKGSPDIPVWGKLLIDLPPGVIPSVVGTIQSWLKRDKGRSVTMEIDGDKVQVTGVSSEHQRELINNWLNNHSS